MSDNEKKKVVSLKGARSKKEQEETVSSNSLVYCSFCGRPNTMVVKMIQGPGVNICSECTMIAVQYLILEDKIPSSDAQKILDAFWRGSKK